MLAMKKQACYVILFLHFSLRTWTLGKSLTIFPSTHRKEPKCQFERTNRTAPNPTVFEATCECYKESGRCYGIIQWSSSAERMEPVRAYRLMFPENEDDPYDFNHTCYRLPRCFFFWLGSHFYRKTSEKSSVEKSDDFRSFLEIDSLKNMSSPKKKRIFRQKTETPYT